MKKIGVLTAGGDCPGLNVVLRGIMKTALNKLDEILVGMGLMAPYDICLRTATSEALVEPQPAYANFAGVLHKLTMGY